ncbi:MAG: glycosyltransferase family 39 protein [Candidatus Omnitrophica bacterium]|nr:glycosyltransferase family 39 protein [Candidatus Omnitrophota bacterium]
MKINRAFFLSLVLVAGAGLRLYKLSANSFWHDEANFILFKPHPGKLLPSLAFISDEILNKGIGLINCGYAVFTTFWSSFSNRDFFLRLSSVLFGIGCIVLIYKTGKLLFDSSTGLIAAVIIAFSPLHIYYSQEFRMYTIVSLFALCSTYALWQFLKTGSRGYVWVYAISHAINFYMHMTAVLLWVAQVVFFILYKEKFKSRLEEWRRCQIMALILMLPGILILLIELLRIGNFKNMMFFAVSTTTQTSPHFLLIPLFSFKNFVAGYNASPGPSWPTVILFAVFFSAAFFPRGKKGELFLCLCCFILPFFILYASQRFMYCDRYLISSSLFLYLIAARGIAGLKKFYAVSALGCILAFSSLSLKNYFSGYLPSPAEERIGVSGKEASREAARYILDNFSDGDVIFHTENNTGLPFRYYFNYYFNQENGQKKYFDTRKIALAVYFTKPGELACFTSWEQLSKREAETIFPVRGHKRVWLVFSSWNFEKAIQPGSEELGKLEWMDKEYMRADERHFKNLIVYLFVRHKDALQFPLRRES